MNCLAQKRWLALAGLLISVTVSKCSAAAGPFSNMVVFGDSLSDVGNLQAEWFINTPGPYYWNGRFSNGPVYAETVMTGLGLPALDHSSAGGTDYAYGGAKTTGTSWPDSIFVSDVDDEVSSYLSSFTPNASTLYVVLAGANDLLQGQTNMSVPVNSLQTSINSLISKGARNFLVINLPPLGDTPRYNKTASDMSTYNARSQQYNSALAAMVASTHTSHPTTTFYQYDLTALFNQALANPALFGLVNTTNSSAPGLEPGDTSYDTSQEVPNPNQYLFWDDVHPTANVHAILGRRVLDLFFPPGDYNRNVATDDGDYVLLRKGFGTTYQPIDYNIWRAHFGQTTVGTPGSGASDFANAVPEPATISIFLPSFLALVFFAPRRNSRRSAAG
jgi:phospholipase/lecithinase/hemolysin